MRQYVWYSPEFNIIVLQSIMDDCLIGFEWSQIDLWEFAERFGTECNPMEMTTWIPMGEL